jgi:predicted Zn-dependent protease
LLLRTQNEAQLAAILGHEFAHYRERHSLQRWRDARDKSNVAAFLGAGFGAIALIPNLALLASIYAYSRDQERQADAIGLEVMAKAGYKPIAASEIWEQLIAEQSKDTVHKDQDVLLAPHPAAAERMVTLRNQAKTFAHASDDVFAERYRSHLKAVRREFLQDELHLRQYGRSLYLFDLMEKNGQADGEIAYSAGEVYRLRDEKGDDAKAREKLEQAIAMVDCPPDAYRSLGLVRMKAGDRGAADGAFRKYLELRPDASDREMIRSYIQAQG